MLYSSADYKKDKFIFYENGQIKQAHAEKLFDLSYDQKSEMIDIDLLSLGWIETRLKSKVKRGDNGRACGQWQMHARLSYPQFVRRSWKDWDEKKFSLQIKKECKRLEKIKYASRQTKKYIAMIKKRKKHMCHYNSGIGSKCSSLYRKKFDAIYKVFATANSVCKIKSYSYEYFYELFYKRIF